MLWILFKKNIVHIVNMQTSEKLININDGAHRKIIFSLLNKDKKICGITIVVDPWIITSWYNDTWYILDDKADP